MNEFKTKNVIMKTEIYETPKCEVIILESEGAILETSPNTTDSATHDRFYEEDYGW